MATIDEQLATMFSRKPKPRPRRVAKLRLPQQVQKVKCLGPPPRPPVRLTREQKRQVNRAHTAAMKILKRGYGDGELLLSYVVWPTAAIIEALEQDAA